jgi:lipopolysaccharide transport system permease protein
MRIWPTITTKLRNPDLQQTLHTFQVVLWPLSLWRHRHLIWQLTTRELGQRYRGTYLGVLWSVLVPLGMLAIYTFVFSAVLQGTFRPGMPTTTGEFALTLFAGLAIFNMFTESISRMPLLILGQVNLVKKVVFPLEILPVTVVLSSVFTSLVTVGLVVIGRLILLGSLSPSALLLPLIYIPLILFVLGLSWFLSSLGVFIRDIGQGITVILQILFFASPVVYPASAIPDPFRWVFALNPLTFLLTSARNVLIWDLPLDFMTWFSWTLLGLVFATLGYYWFRRTSKGFSDVL